MLVRTLRSWGRGLALLACIAAGATAASAQSLETDVPIVYLHDGMAPVEATAAASLIEDRTGNLSLADVTQRGGWQPPAPGATALSFGVSRSVWWVRWRLTNTGLEKIGAVVDLGTPRQDYVDWFVLREDGRRVYATRSGDRLPFSSRLLPTRTLALPVDVAANETVDVLVRVTSYDGRMEAMPARIHENTTFFAGVELENFVYTLFHGALIALTLYNLLLYASTRRIVFGTYVAFMTSFVVWSFTFRGYSFQYLWPDSPRLNNDLLPALGGLMFASIGVFSMFYLRLRSHQPRWALRAHWALIGANLLVGVPVLAGHYLIAGMFGWVAGLLEAVMCLASGVWLLWRGQRQARFFVAAFAVLAVAATGYVLESLHVLHGTWFTTWGVPIGSMLQMLLLALGLADAMNVLKAEKLALEERQRQAARAHAEHLEREVLDRTQALARANAKLQELAVTDELTGAYNRRHFNDYCRAMLEKRPRGLPLAMCMFDIDHFKRFNDHAGHAAGDRALRAVTEAVQAELRRSRDALFRLGGEEFGVVYGAASPEAALQFAERLMHAVRALDLPHPMPGLGRVTASFGVAWSGDWPVESLTVDQLCAAADRALYATKASGRDGVSLSLVSVDDAEQI